MNAVLLRARNLVWQSGRYRTEYGPYALLHELETDDFYAMISRILYGGTMRIPRTTCESLYGLDSLMLMSSDGRRQVLTVYSLGADS